MALREEAWLASANPHRPASADKHARGTQKSTATYRVLPSSSIDKLFFLLAISVVALGFLGGLDAIRSIYAQRVAAAVERTLGLKTFAASLADNRHAESTSPLRDLASVCAFIRSRGAAVLFDLPFAPVLLAVLYLIHPVLFWRTLAGAVALVAVNQLAVGRNDAQSVERSAAASLSKQVFSRYAKTLHAIGHGPKRYGGLGAPFLRSDGLP